MAVRGVASRVMTLGSEPVGGGVGGRDDGGVGCQVLSVHAAVEPQVVGDGEVLARGVVGHLLWRRAGEGVGRAEVRVGVETWRRGGKNEQLGLLAEKVNCHYYLLEIMLLKLWILEFTVSHFRNSMFDFNKRPIKCK